MLVDIVGFYFVQGVCGVVIKFGEQGVYFCMVDGCEGMVVGECVEWVVDMVGVGDGFVVGVVSVLFEGCGIEQVVVWGNWIGVFVIQVIGDLEGLLMCDVFDWFENVSNCVDCLEEIVIV